MIAMADFVTDVRCPVGRASAQSRTGERSDDNRIFHRGLRGLEEWRKKPNDLAPQSHTQRELYGRTRKAQKNTEIAEVSKCDRERLRSGAPMVMPSESFRSAASVGHHESLEPLPGDVAFVEIQQEAVSGPTP